MDFSGCRRMAFRIMAGLRSVLRSHPPERLSTGRKSWCAPTLWRLARSGLTQACRCLKKRHGRLVYRELPLPPHVVAALVWCITSARATPIVAFAAIPQSRLAAHQDGHAHSRDCVRPTRDAQGSAAWFRAARHPLGRADQSRAEVARPRQPVDDAHLSGGGGERRTGTRGANVGPDDLQNAHGMPRRRDEKPVSK